MMNNTIGKFNKNVDLNNNINGSILTKDQIIMQNDYALLEKDRKIRALFIFLIYLIIIYTPFYLVINGNISKKIGYIVLAVSLLIVGIIILLVMFNTGQRTVNNIMKESKKVSKELSKDFLKKLVSSKYDKAICPKSKCVPNGGGKKPKLPNYDYKSGNEVWLDNSQNVFSEGDIPSVGGNSLSFTDKNGITNTYTPKPFFKGDKDSKIYTCKWDGDPTKMTNMDKGTVFKTTVPCEYFPGYKSI